MDSHIFNFTPILIKILTPSYNVLTHEKLKFKKYKVRVKDIGQGFLTGKTEEKKINLNR